MDPLSVRSRGRRAAPRGRKSGPFSMGPHQGLSGGGRPGEFRLNGQQMEALEQLYTASPAIAAARSVLHGQLLGGGIVLRRNGQDVELKAEFQRYLSTKWLAFAGDCLDSYLKWGLVVVAYDEDYELQRTKKKAAAGADTPAVLAPLVPPRECIEISYVQGGRMGYTREYLVYNTGPNFASRADEDARVFIREQPDAAGNVLSPMSKSFELGSFVHALTELALTAEITCARPRIWTQQRVKNGKEMDSSSLFFDSESRQVATDLDIEGNTAAAQALSMQSQLVQLINKLQTRKQEDNGIDIQRGSFSGRGVAAGSTSHVPPEVPPAIMSLPKVRNATPIAPPLHAVCAASHAPVVLAGPRSGAQHRPATVGAGRPGSAAAPVHRALWRGVWRAGRPSLQRTLCVKVNVTVRTSAFKPHLHPLLTRSAIAGFRC